MSESELAAATASLSQNKFLVFKATQSQQSGDQAPPGSLAAFQDAISKKHKPNAKRKRISNSVVKSREGRKSVASGSTGTMGAQGFVTRFAPSQGGDESGSQAFKTSADLAHRSRASWRARMQDRRANEVNLYREYRHGDLPDVQIAHKDLIKPLQGLHTDSIIAKELFVVLFNEIYKSIEVLHPANSDSIRHSLCAALSKLLTAPTQNSSSPEFISVAYFCFLHIMNDNNFAYIFDAYALKMSFVLI